MMLEFISLLAILAAIYYFFKGKAQKPQEKFPVKGKVVYADEGRKSGQFESYKYRIKAKPDFLIREPSGELVLVEYKSRLKNPNPSDVEQLIASAICVKEKYPDLSQGMVYTRGGKKMVDLSGSVDELAQQIWLSLQSARRAKCGVEVRPSPSLPKCRSCSYNNICKSRFQENFATR